MLNSFQSPCFKSGLSAGDKSLSQGQNTVSLCQTIPFIMQDHKYTIYYVEIDLDLENLNSYWSKYCRFGNFRENFVFANCIKRHIGDVKNSQLRQDLPISINDRVILPFHKGLFSRNFSYAMFRENKVLSKISEFKVLAIWIKRIGPFYLLFKSMFWVRKNASLGTQSICLIEKTEKNHFRRVNYCISYQKYVVESLHALRWYRTHVKR